MLIKFSGEATLLGKTFTEPRVGYMQLPNEISDRPV